MGPEVLPDLVVDSQTPRLNISMGGGIVPTDKVNRSTMLVDLSRCHVTSIILVHHYVKLSLREPLWETLRPLEQEVWRI
jgi:hypothetical protein